MSQLRDLLSDLVEKRLWPVALLLVGALVAVPLVLAKSAPSSDGASPAPPAAVAAAPAGAPAPGEPVVSVATNGETPAAPLGGHAKDPFHQQYLPPKPAAASTQTVTTPNRTTPGASGGAGAPSSGGVAPGQRVTIYGIVHLDVRFGKAGGAMRTFHDVARLTALPSTSNPVAVFFGVRKDRKTAVFMISSDVHARGDGSCVPSRSDCQGFQLQEGQTELLDVAANDGKVTHYELDLVKVAIEWTTSKTKAQAAHARASSAGQRLLGEQAATSAVANGLRYSLEDGVLLPVPAPFLSAAPDAVGSAGASASVAAPQASADAQRSGWVLQLP